MDRDKQLHPTEKVSSIQRSRGCPINLIPQTKPASGPERLRERCLERGSPNHSSMHSNLPMHSNLAVNSKPKNMLLMIRNGDRPSQSLRAETRGLDSNPRPEPSGAVGPGRPTLKESQYHRRPINPTKDEQDPSSRKDRYARQESHVVPY